MKVFDPLSEDSAKTLDPIIDLLARYTRSIFDHPDRPVSDVGEWVKKQDCWKMMIENIPSLESYREDLRTLCCSIPEAYQIKSWREK